MRRFRQSLQRAGERHVAGETKQCEECLRAIAAGSGNRPAFRSQIARQKAGAVSETEAEKPALYGSILANAFSTPAFGGRFLQARTGTPDRSASAAAMAAVALCRDRDIAGHLPCIGEERETASHKDLAIAIVFAPDCPFRSAQPTYILVDALRKHIPLLPHEQLRDKVVMKQQSLAVQRVARGRAYG